MLRAFHVAVNVNVKQREVFPLYPLLFGEGGGEGTARGESLFHDPGWRFVMSVS